MAVTKQSRTTKGRNQQVIVPIAAAISTQPTLAAFIANAPTGTIGVYDGLDALHNNAITANELFYIVQKRSDGSIKRTTPELWSNVVATRRAYIAPVLCVGSLGWFGTGGSMNLPTIAARQNFEFAIQELTEGNDPYPIWNYEYNSVSGDTEPIILGNLVSQVNDRAALQYRNNARLVNAKLKANGTYGNLTLTGTTPTLIATFGSRVLTLGGTTPTVDAAVGDLLSFDGAATPTAVIGSIYRVVAVSAGVSVTLDRPYNEATQTFTQAEAQGTRVKRVTGSTAFGIEFTAINTNENFVIMARQNLSAATITNRSAYTRGNGTAYQIAELEKEGNTYAGLTAGNTQFGNRDFGVEDLFVTSQTETYDSFNIVGRQFIDLVGQSSQERVQEWITIAAPRSSGGLTASLNTLFGT